MTTKKKAPAFNKTAFIKNLIKDLRSGIYEQIEGRLTEGNDTFCVLGVACERYSKDYNHGVKFNYDGDFVWYGDAYDNLIDRLASRQVDPSDIEGELESAIEAYTTELPEGFAKLLGTTENGAFRVDGRTVLNLINLNDSGITFEGLAAILETYELTTSSSNKELTTYKDFEKLFSKTKLAKTWREKAIREGSEYETLLNDKEEENED